MIKTLSEESARHFLRSRHFARFACVLNGAPYVVPINYTFENDFINCHSLPGMKIDDLRKHPRACLQVDEISHDLCWKSVLAFGNYEEVVDRKERDLIYADLLKELLVLMQVEPAVAENVNAPEINVFRIRVDRITGVSEGTASDEFLLVEDAADGSYSAG